MINRVRIIPGDCLEAMAALKAEGVTVQAVVTDPPYHLTASVRPAASKGFMGKAWDGGDVAFRSETWRLAWELLPPGGHLVAFGGTRTYHRMAVAIEDAGFEIRDTLAWLYGTGFPKSLNVSKAINKAAGATPEAAAWEGWGTALKPAVEPIILARKPLVGTVAATVLEHGTGALNIDGCRVESEVRSQKAGGMARKTSPVFGVFSQVPTHEEYLTSLGRHPANILHDGSDEVLSCFPHTASGSAARFFYSAKAGASDRLGSKHPTVKPVKLMQWLVRLVTPPGGTVLDPFSGTGTTAEACVREGFNCIAIEREAEYLADIRARLAQVSTEVSCEVQEREPSVEDFL